ncbi:hypothetical protein KR009_006104 [Drosophila setifemur]|nr:hypothetical protein KR009_006104 [Drosophila setifemur]
MTENQEAEVAPAQVPAEAPADAVPAAEAPAPAPPAEGTLADEVGEQRGSIVGEGEQVETSGEQPPGEEGVPLEPGEDGEVPTDGQAQGLQGARDERKRIKLERIKQRLEEDNQMKLAALALEEAQKPKTKLKPVVENEEGMDSEKGSLQSIGSEEGEGDIAEFQSILTEVNLMEPDRDSVEESAPEDVQGESGSSEEELLPRIGDSLKTTFLRQFDSLPSLADISLDVTEVEPEPEVVAKTSNYNIDEGGFVEAADEEGVGESESASGSQDGATGAGAGDAEEDSESESDDLMDDLIDEEAEGKEKRVVIHEEMDTMAMFAEVADIEIQLRPERETSKIEEPPYYRLIADFIHHLVSAVVVKLETAEQGEKMLDKMKMMVALRDEVDDYVVEKHTNVVLNGVIGEYYRRQGKFQNFQILPPDDEYNEGVRYMGALNTLDRLRERVKVFKINQGHVIHKAMLELCSLIALSFNEELRLEGLMRKTLIRRDMDRLRRAVEIDLRRMMDLRNQISERRYELNLNLHTLAFVDEKVARFEAVTETLTISQIMCVSGTIMQLGKQLEEKCKAVSEMQSHYKKSMIEETCIREKRDMIAYTLNKAKEEFKKQFQHRNDLRKKLTALQFEHANLKAQRAKLEMKGGLLFKSGLMYDYDKCMDEVLARRNKIKALKNTVLDLNKRIAMLESMAVRRFSQS